MMPHSTATLRQRYGEDVVLKAKVTGGRLIVDEPTDLPEGTEISLVPADPHDAMSVSERERLHGQIMEAIDSPESEDVDSATLLAELGAMRAEAPVGG